MMIEFGSGADGRQPIPIDAMSIYHITDKMVQNKPAFRDSRIMQQPSVVPDFTDNDMVDPNAAFDLAMLKKAQNSVQKTDEDFLRLRGRFGPV